MGVKAWIEEGSRICNPFAKFAFYWFAFNGIYQESHPRPEGQKEHKLIEHFITCTRDEAITVILGDIKECYANEICFLASRTPRVAGRALEGYCGVVNVKAWEKANTEAKKCKAVKTVCLSRIEEWSDLANLDPNYRRKRLGEIIGLLYAIRNNLFHGGKEPYDRSDLCVVKDGAAILKVICDRCTQFSNI